ncbi:hypothetical protein PCO31010_01419 [Pandoraea commovens]|uniref:Uncharacterized protein n=1 Tax=Pandoraea commovens TaxID=2508289 RepID=A0A5E4TJN6_9BURK|nr:hypothetical protein PCO31010_01419 [Pandoraea commovens]
MRKVMVAVLLCMTGLAGVVVATSPAAACDQTSSGSGK